MLSKTFLINIYPPRLGDVGTVLVADTEPKDATDALLAAIEAARLQAHPDPLPPEGERRTLRDELYEGDFRARDSEPLQGH